LAKGVQSLLGSIDAEPCCRMLLLTIPKHQHDRGRSATRKVNIFALLMAVLFFVVTGFQPAPQTQVGVHCPTAPVQTVLVPVKGKCGCPVTYRLSKPRAGDKAFVQCRCAEKKSSERPIPTAPRVVLFFQTEPSVVSPGRLVIPDEIPNSHFAASSLVIPPPVHPPSTV